MTYSSSLLVFFRYCFGYALATVVAGSLILSAQAQSTVNSDGSTTGSINQGAIAIYSMKRSSRGVLFTQARTREIYDPSTGETSQVDVPGKRIKSSSILRKFVVIDLETGKYRRISYISYLRFDPEIGRHVRLREFATHSGDGTPNCLFETDPDANRNYMVFSLEGTGTGFANCSGFHDGETGHYNAGARIATLSGVVRLQKIRTSLGPYQFMAPSAMAGNWGYEYQLSSANSGGIHRFISVGDQRMTLHRALTREVFDVSNGIPTMDDAQSVVVDALLRKGYVEEEPATATSP